MSRKKMALEILIAFSNEFRNGFGCFGFDGMSTDFYKASHEIFKSTTAELCKTLLIFVMRKLFLHNDDDAES